MHPSTIAELQDIIAEYPSQIAPSTYKTKTGLLYKEFYVRARTEALAVDMFYHAMCRGYLDYGHGPIFWRVVVEWENKNDGETDVWFTVYARCAREGVSEREEIAA